MNEENMNAAEAVDVENKAEKVESAAETVEDPTVAPDEETNAVAEDPALRAHFDGLMAQAEELKGIYPGFDLQKEMQDERFFKWTAPGVGMSLKEAYMALHGEEILTEGMRYALERGRERVAASVRTGSARPREGGLLNGAPQEIRLDPTAMTAKERADLRRRVARGEKIRF